jgi:hypothetical protein
MAYDRGGMNRLIRRLAEATELPPARAADEIDKLVHRIVTKLRRGESVRLPGLGSFIPGLDPGFLAEESHEAQRPQVRRTSGRNR